MESAKLVIGIILIIAGCFVIFQVLGEIQAIYTTPEKIMIFKVILPEETASREIIVNENRVMLPPFLINYMAYSFALILLSLAGMLGASMMTKGVRLIISKP